MKEQNSMDVNSMCCILSRGIDELYKAKFLDRIHAAFVKNRWKWNTGVKTRDKVPSRDDIARTFLKLLLNSCNCSTVTTGRLLVVRQGGHISMGVSTALFSWTKFTSKLPVLRFNA